MTRMSQFKYCVCVSYKNVDKSGKKAVFESESVNYDLSGCTQWLHVFVRFSAVHGSLLV